MYRKVASSKLNMISRDKPSDNITRVISTSLLSTHY